MEQSIEEIVLTTALRTYLALSRSEQEQLEDSQPRRGKGIQTDIDVATAENFRIRIDTINICLQAVGQIAGNVRKWASEDDGSKDVDRWKNEEIEEGVSSGTQDENLIFFDAESERFAPEFEDDEPYMLPTTGQWITPITSKSAGPSNRESSLKDQYDFGQLNVRAFSVSIPNIPTNVEQTTHDKDRSLLLSVDKAPNLIDLDDDWLVAQRLQALYEEEAFIQNTSYQDEARYARQVREEEMIRADNFKSNTATAKQLAHEWRIEGRIQSQDFEELLVDFAQKERSRDEQQADLNELRNQQEEDEERFRKDRAAARAAQEEWESEEREALEGVLKWREQAEREEKEDLERKVAEAEEEVRRAEQEELERIFAEAEEEIRRAEEEELERVVAEAEEEERRARQADCLACMEPSDRVDMCLLTCEHYYCGGCIVGKSSF